MSTNFPNWSGVDTAALVVSGLLVVFAALVVIIVFIWAMGKVMNIGKGEKSEEKKEAAPAVKAAPAAPVAAPVESDELNDEVVAAISAAISMMMLAEGNTKPFVIRSIKRVKEARNAWNAAGVTENVRPF